MTEEIITGIDQHGQHYPLEKSRAHAENLHHLAISVFIFHRGRLLLQQRADSKYHAAGLWANSCCSHPHWQESLSDCAHRRLQQELGFDCPLETVGTVYYQTAVGELFEHETAHWFTAQLPNEPPMDCFNPAEVQALKWASPEQLQQMLHNSDSLAPWFHIYLQHHFRATESGLIFCNKLRS